MDPYEQEYQQLKRQVITKSNFINKHEKIRVNQWLQKLDVGTNNDVWKKNKNLYMTALLEMINQNQFMKPFSHAPPEGPLPKLTVYDIDYPIRQKIQKKSSYKKSKSQSKSQKNSSRREKSLTNRENLMGAKRKIIFEEYVRENEQRQNSSAFGNLNKTMKTEELFLISQDEGTQTKKIKNGPDKTQKGLNILRRTLKLMGNHYDEMYGQKKYKQVLEAIVKTGDIYGEDLRQVKLENEESVRFEKYSERIKQKIYETDLNSLEFLEYLRKVNSEK